MKEKYEVLIVEEDLNGHHGEWIKHVVREAEEVCKNNEDVLLLLNKKFPKHHKEVYELIKSSDRIDAKYIFRGEEATKFKQSSKDWRTVKENIKRHEIERCIFMGINKYQHKFLVDRLSEIRCRFLGVYLHPFTGVSIVGDTISESIRGVLYYLRRMILFMAMTSNRKIKRIYILDDLTAEEKLKKYRIGSSEVEVIPDPLPKYLSNISTERVDADEKGELNKYLIFGAIRPQKGVIEAISAVESLTTKYKSKIHLKIVGKGNESYENEIEKMIDKMEEKSEIGCIERKDEYISKKDVMYEFETSDVVLLPYQRTEGSSGVLGIAAMTRTPVIGPSKGLIGRKIKKYGMGTTTNTRKVSDIHRAIKASIEEKPQISISGASKYVDDHSPKTFVYKLFEPLV